MVCIMIISLMCSLLALIPPNSLFKDIVNSGYYNSLINQEFKGGLTSYLIYYFKNEDIIQPTRTIASQLVQTLLTTSKVKMTYGQTCSSDIELVQQYLRKFNFFYHYYFVKYYPNDLGKLSRRKTNMLAIKSLFFIQSL